MRSGGAECTQRGGQVSGSGGSPAPDTESRGGGNKPLRFFAGIRLQQLTLNTSGGFFLFFTDLYAFFNIHIGYDQSTYCDFALLSVCWILYGTVLFV